MATTKITSPELFDLASLDSALQLPSGTTAERPANPSTGEWRYNTDDNKIEFYDGSFWLAIQDEEIPVVPSENFSAILYTGDGTASNSITGLGFQPDWIFIKRRNAAGSWSNYDSSRGSSKYNFLNLTGTESTSTSYLASFDSDGFTVGSNTAVNTNGGTYIAYCWKVNGGTTVTNTDGSANSTVQVNQKTGSSIIQYSASGSDLTYGHGLSQEPNFILVKARTWASAWFAWHKESGGSQYGGYFDQTSAVSAGNSQVGTPNATTIGANHPGTRNTGDYIVYAFHDVAGYSKFGTYTGNGSTSGPVVNIGFEPAFIILRTANGTAGYNWVVKNNKTSTSNPRSTRLRINLSNAEDTGDDVNFLTNGFQIISSSNDVNLNGAPYIYMAFAADPSTAPVLADSFNTTLYTGTSATHAITGLGFSPSLVWTKDRGNAEQHVFSDVLRGAGNDISSNTTAAETNRPTGFLSFDSDGFTLGTDGGGIINDSARGPYVAWNWKANSIPTINTDGSNTNVVVSANQAAGFSVIKWIGDGVNNATIGHGLGTTPELLIMKTLSVLDNWRATSTYLANANGYLFFNTTGAETTTLSGDGSITRDGLGATTFTCTAGSSTSNNTNKLNDAYIAYAFHSVAGFSKIGTYTGNGGTQAITGLGFSPDCVIIKSVTFAEVWSIFDTSRGPNRRLTPSGADQEYTNSGGGYLQSFDSDGFTVQPGASSASNVNKNAETYIYLASKANPTHGGVSAGKMAYLVVAGGGGGGWNSSTWDGAGGGGGVTTSYGTESGGSSPVEPSLTLASGTYTITIGAGGFSNSGAVSVNGNNSTITGNATITAVGGGGGGDVTTSPLGKGRDGGSGGGGSNYSGNPLGGSGEPAQGYQGGQGSSSNGGGGGGAGKPGLSDGTGGDGIYCSISGTATYYAGGAAGYNGTGTPGQGGGGTPSSAPGGVNTGGGGAGTRTATSSDGGSGIVILRLKTSEYSGTVTGSPTVTTDGDETILTYTGSGTYVH